jgi:hypothetical protein
MDSIYIYTLEFKNIISGKEYIPYGGPGWKRIRKYGANA